MSITIDDVMSGKRIDQVIPQLVTTITRSQIQKFIKSKKVLLNDKPTRSSYKVVVGDVISFEENINSKRVLYPIDKPLTIIFEDDNIIVIDKPQGLTVHPSETSEDETLAHYLLHHVPEIENVGEHTLRPGIVHRLDNLTSGIIVAAKNQETFDELKLAWKNGFIRKEYLALIWGDLVCAGSISGKISRSKRSGRMVANIKEGRDAVTLYNPLKHFTGTTLVAIATHTGRTHQIRAHFKSIGMPVVGDPLYVYRKVKRRFPRLFLHAYMLSFPYKGAQKTFISELPKEFTDFLENLKLKK